MRIVSFLFIAVFENAESSSSKSKRERTLPSLIQSDPKHIDNAQYLAEIEEGDNARMRLQLREIHEALTTTKADAEASQCILILALQKSKKIIQISAPESFLEPFEDKHYDFNHPLNPSSGQFQISNKETKQLEDVRVITAYGKSGEFYQEIVEKKERDDIVAAINKKQTSLLNDKLDELNQIWYERSEGKAIQENHGDYYIVYVQGEMGWNSSWWSNLLFVTKKEQLPTSLALGHVLRKYQWNADVSRHCVV